MKKEEMNKQDNMLMSRRSFLKAGAAVAAVTAMAPEAFARNFGPDAQPVRYPDPDVIALDKDRV